MVVGLAHAATIAPLYHVGSFDDDASYILSAKALLAGGGLTAPLPFGDRVVGLYPPGYSLLISPLVWAWSHTFLPLRLLSLVAYGAVFPLTWHYLESRARPRVRFAVLLVLALGPVLATFATMVMAEAPFVVVLLLLLIFLDRWTAGPVLSRYMVCVIGAAAALVWLKQAGIGLLVGLVVWLVARRTRTGGPARAALLAGGLLVSLLPVLIERSASGIPLAGSRYSQELGGFYQGGLLTRITDVLPGSAWHLLSTALPATLVPYLEPLPLDGHWPDLWKVLSWHVTVLAALGAARWWRRRRDAAVVMVAVYLVESVLWPFVNERRAVLVLPLLCAWYVDGACVMWGSVRELRRFRPSRWVVAGVLAIGPLVAQFPRDYLYPWGRSGSQFQGSRYVALLRSLPPGVVETDYRSTTSLFTGQPTNWNAFVDTQSLCFLPTVEGDLAKDHAAYLLLGDVNKPGVLDGPCLLQQARLGTWATPLLHTERDDATVFELTGPDTGEPNLSDRLTGRDALVVTEGQTSKALWVLAGGTTVSQVSVGEVEGVDVRSTRLEVLERSGQWKRVASAPGPVGDGRSAAPFLLAQFDHPTPIWGVRVVVTTAVRGSVPAISDVAAFGPGGATS